MRACLDVLISKLGTVCDRITSTVLWGASGNGRPCRDFKIRCGFYLEDVSLVTDGILLDQPAVRGEATARCSMAPPDLISRALGRTSPAPTEASRTSSG